MEYTENAMNFVANLKNQLIGDIHKIVAAQKGQVKFKKPLGIVNNDAAVNGCYQEAYITKLKNEDTETMVWIDWNGNGKREWHYLNQDDFFVDDLAEIIFQLECV